MVNLVMMYFIKVHVYIDSIGDFRNVFKFHAYSVNKRLFLTTAKLVRRLSDVATTNVRKVDTVEPCYFNEVLGTMKITLLYIRFLIISG